MLDYGNATTMRLECDYAVEVRRKVTKLSKQRIRRSAGDEYKVGWNNSPPIFTNLIQRYIQNTLPHMVFFNPAFALSNELGQKDDESKLLDPAMATWVFMVKLSRELRMMALNTLYDFGVGALGMEDHPADFLKPPKERRLVPFFRSMSPRRYFRDSNNLEGRRTPRFEGEIFIRDRDEMLAELDEDGKPKFSRTAINSMITDEGLDEMRKDILSDPVQPQIVSRNQVVGYEFYSHETGQIFTLGWQSSTDGGRHGGQYLCDPQDWHGPVGFGSPYTLFGVHDIPEEPYPLSPLAISHGQMREINAHQSQAAEDAATAKRLIIHDGSNRHLRDAILTATNGSVVNVPGFNKNAVESIEYGGPQAANLDYIDRREQDLDRDGGMTATIQGELTGVTKGEVDQAQAAADQRTRWKQVRFREGVEDAASTIAWLMQNTERFKIEVVVKEEEGEGSYRGTFEGGLTPGKPIPIGRPTTVVKPYSMEYVDEKLRQFRMQQAAAMVEQLLAIARAYPEARVENIADDMFAALNIDDAAQRYIDFDLMNEMRNVSKDAQMAEGQAVAHEGNARAVQGAVATQEAAAMAGSAA